MALDGNGGKLSLDCLPEDVLFVILSYCDLWTLLRLARVNRTLNQMSSHDSVWIRIARRCANIRPSDKRADNSWKAMCRVSVNWMRGYCKDRCLLRFKCNYMPCVQLGRPHQILISLGADIVIYNKSKKKNQAYRQRTLCGHTADVAKFVVCDAYLLSCSMDKTIRLWNTKTWRCDGVLVGHDNGVYSVDGYRDTVISGGRDGVVKVWSKRSMSCVRELAVHDHVWCVGFNQSSRIALCGTAGHSTVHAPLQLWSLESGSLVSGFRMEDRGKGRGILSVKWESPSTFLSCGYDTTVRYWDTRINPSNACVVSWDDPHDSTVYCLDSDNKWMVVSGTSRYGVVRVWDKRVRRSVRSFYAGRTSSSPVYSLRFNRTTLVVALANGLRTLDFSG
ncbi:F-box/WD repeat-containing protein 4 isoform X1 [Nematostella vectensis]|uniref:F-box/WD repeat-containing protein 4 isoform X1 n=1 Tax=Nematostella vectensis TaxID=45351 RepID=UPI001390242A|nr:F-box/WD repeat-containing protein 4 isoform X1 [Nematostella vectensis]